MNLSLLAQRVVLSLLLLACGLGIWQVQKGYRADLLFEQSQTLQEAWTEDLAVLEEGNWLSAGQDLESALALNSTEPEYLQQYGLLLAMEHALLGERVTQEDLQRIYGNALEMHRLGIRQQPASPYGWTYFALAKARAGQLDGEFELALERSNALGPWEKIIHELVAFIVRYYWSAMTDTGRYLSAVQLQRALSTPGFDRPVIDVFADSDVLLDQLCPVLDHSQLTDAARLACQLP